MDVSDDMIHLRGKPFEPWTRCRRWKTVWPPHLRSSWTGPDRSRMIRKESGRKRRDSPTTVRQNLFLSRVLDWIGVRKTSYGAYPSGALNEAPSSKGRPQTLRIKLD